MAEKDFREQKLSDDIKRIGEQLAQIAPSDVPKLQEYIFVNVFLPLFAGDENRMYNATFETWINYAGSAYATVNIIDPNGKVLFSVPPLFDRAAINPVNEYGASIAHVVTTAGQYARIHPTQGTNYLNKELSKRAMVMKVPANILNNLETWNSIFKRYGRPEIMTIEDKVISEKSNITEYDEFEPL